MNRSYLELFPSVLCMLSYALTIFQFFYSVAVYKALYKSFGGFAADVVAAIDQVNLASLHNFK